MMTFPSIRDVLILLCLIAAGTILIDAADRALRVAHGFRARRASQRRSDADFEADSKIIDGLDEVLFFVHDLASCDACGSVQYDLSHQGSLVQDGATLYHVTSSCSNCSNERHMALDGVSFTMFGAMMAYLYAMAQEDLAGLSSGAELVFDPGSDQPDQG